MLRTVIRTTQCCALLCTIHRGTLAVLLHIIGSARTYSICALSTFQWQLRIFFIFLLTRLYGTNLVTLAKGENEMWQSK